MEWESVGDFRQVCCLLFYQSFNGLLLKNERAKLEAWTAQRTEQVQTKERKHRDG